MRAFWASLTMGNFIDFFQHNQANLKLGPEYY